MLFLLICAILKYSTSRTILRPTKSGEAIPFSSNQNCDGMFPEIVIHESLIIDNTPLRSSILMLNASKQSTYLLGNRETNNIYL